MALVVRASVEADLPAIAAIYADAVLHGTASFELEPPTEEEMRRRRAALIAGGYPYSSPSIAVRCSAMLTQVLIARAPVTGSPSRIRSMWRAPPRAGASGTPSCRR